MRVRAGLAINFGVKVGMRVRVGIKVRLREIGIEVSVLNGLRF